MSTALVVIGDMAALAAAVFAFLALRQAREAVREARRERREAEHARLVCRVEWAREMIEQIDRMAEDDQRTRPPADTPEERSHFPRAGAHRPSYFDLKKSVG